MSRSLGKMLVCAAASVIAASILAIPAFAEETEPAAGDDINSDRIVWIGGKDTKASKDGKTPAALYKTESIQTINLYAGGKQCVAVTGADIDTVEKFIAKLDSRCNLDRSYAGTYSPIASAKMKNGIITVTAGKKPGAVKVWSYEVKDKKVVTTASAEGAPVVSYGSIDPVCYDFTVKMGNSKIVLCEKAFIENKKDDIVNTIELIPGSVSKAYNIINDKTTSSDAAAPDVDNDYVVKITSGKNTVNNVSADVSVGKLTVSVSRDYAIANAKKEKGDKLKLLITNTQTAKSAGITVIIREATDKEAAVRELTNAIAAAEALNEEDYAEGWSAVSAALTLAKAVDTETAEIDEITKAADTLKKAIANLKPRLEVAVESLKSTIAEANALNSADYAEGWTELVNALAAAMNVDTEKDDFSVIISATSNLKSAMAALRSHKDVAVEELNAAIAEAELLKEADYARGWTEFAAALEAAKELNTQTANLAAVRSAKTALTTAQGNLRTPRGAAIDDLNKAIEYAEKTAAENPTDPLTDILNSYIATAKALDTETATIEEINSKANSLISFCDRF